jgi:hypothetical protein
VVTLTVNEQGQTQEKNGEAKYRPAFGRAESEFNKQIDRAQQYSRNRVLPGKYRLLILSVRLNVLVWTNDEVPNAFI